jgi:hypothetical protein
VPKQRRRKRAQASGRLVSGYPAVPSPTAVNDRVREYRRQQVLRRLGQVLMIVGALVALVHVGSHAFGAEPSLTVDVLAGYPMAAVVFVVGAVLIGR